MDDLVNMLPSWMFTAIISVFIFLIVGIIFARLYRRASAEQAFVRTGLGGQKVVMSGGAIVMPIFHEIIPINMNTLKLEVSRSTIDSLITKDRMRVDVVVAFFVRVKPSVKVIDELTDRPDIIILDPPRDGIHPKAIGKIIEFGVDRMVYISCKPTSLARDLVPLQEGGYKVEKVCCVDMFPFTSGIETVCLLSHVK